jgi:hypothetical protein
LSWLQRFNAPPPDSPPRVITARAQVADFTCRTALEAGESVVTVARWLGHSSPAITLGYYAHFAACQWKLPRFSPGLMMDTSRCCARLRLGVDCKAKETNGLRKC